MFPISSWNLSRRTSRCSVLLAILFRSSSVRIWALTILVLAILIRWSKKTSESRNFFFKLRAAKLSIILSITANSSFQFRINLTPFRPKSSRKSFTGKFLIVLSSAFFRNWSSVFKTDMINLLRAKFPPPRFGELLTQLSDLQKLKFRQSYTE